MTGVGFMIMVTLSYELVKRPKQTRIGRGIDYGKFDQANVCCTGAIERPVSFAGNDIPGVLLASAVKLCYQFWGIYWAKNGCYYQ